jgi:hypothetical protein
MSEAQMHAFYAAWNGIAVGFNIGALVFMQRDETWYMWLGIIVCGTLMISSIKRAGCSYDD